MKLNSKLRDINPDRYDKRNLALIDTLGSFGSAIGLAGIVVPTVFAIAHATGVAGVG